MDKKEYIIKQLARTDHKRFENYCITRIFHKVDNLGLQFVTQQMFKRSDGKIALADLYLPQINMIIEIDEGQHLNAVEEDRKRDEEIIQNKVKVFEEVIIYDLKPKRIDTTQSIEKINQSIDDIVIIINRKVKDLNKLFKPWTCTYLEPKHYISIGKINAKEVPSFKTIQDVANLFNRYPDKKMVYKDGRYIGTQTAYFKDKEGSNVRVWCPKLAINADDYQKNPYLNTISADGKRIRESSKNIDKAMKFVEDFIEGEKNSLAIRYTFAKYKDSIGEDRYKFRGVFKLNKEESQKESCVIWDKIGDAISLKEYHENFQY